MTLLNDSLSAYLTPLLNKHAAGQAITYDDLMHAWQASQAVMKQDFDPAVSKHLRELHESQLKAYRDAARLALTQHAQSVSLPSLEVTDSNADDEESHVAKVMASIASDNDKPDWKVDDQIWEQAWTVPLKERARVAWRSAKSSAAESQEQQQQPGGTAEDDEAAAGESNTHDLEDTEEEEGEEEEKLAAAAAPTAKTTVKRTIGQKRAAAAKASTSGKGLLKKKALSTATGAGGTNKPAGQRPPRGRRGRRGGGRGGAGAAK